VSLDIAGRLRYPPPQPDWLALHEEDVIDPALPIIDAHHHIWEEPGNPYLLDHLAADLASGHNIRHTVLVEAHYGYRCDGPEALRPVGETEKVVALAAEAKVLGLATDICAAVVGHADLTLARAVEAVLEEHISAAGHRFRGVRHSVSRDPHFPDGIVVRAAPAGLLADPRYREGLATVARRSLSYDAMLYHQQIPELAAAARALPQLRIMLDHFGCIIGVGPYAGRGDETFAAWRADMVELATCPNVSVKLGGLGMIITGANWHERVRPPSSLELAQAWRPYVETCINLFGVSRCCFESNFPVDKAMYSYRTLWNAFKRLTAGASTQDRAALFHDTAARFYRIGDDAQSR
jgi:L-fuconolactonase